MSPKDPATRSQLRAIQYWYIDGTFEFSFGLLCLILALYFFVEISTQGTWVSALIDASLVLFILGGAWLINRLLRQLKERITYPRTGYVSYQRKSGLKRGWRLLLGMLIGGAVSALTIILLNNDALQFAVIPLVSGCVLAFVLVIMGWRSALPRFYLLAGVSAGIGIILAFNGPGNYLGVAVYYLAVSLVLFASGAHTLFNYLRQNPAPREEQDEG
jgi:hypothetical protein